MGESRTFRERFCERFEVVDADYENAALIRLLHPPWDRWVSKLTRRFPDWFKTDLEIIRQLGRIDRMNGLISEARGVRSDYARRRDFGFSRKFLKRRLSSARIFEAARQCWMQERHHLEILKKS